MTTTWNTNDLSIEDCARLSGWTVAELIEMLAKPNFKNHAICRAAGAWNANDLEGHALWLSLAEHAPSTADINEALERR